MFDDSGKGRPVWLLTGTAFMLGIAIMMNIFACTLVDQKNTYPLLILFTQILAPLPLALCGMQKSDDFSGDVPMFAFLGWFFTGCFLAVALGGPFAMLHEGSFTGQQLGLVLGSQMLTYLVFFMFAKMKKHSGYDSF
eukprot:TRINITY_DN14581_c2_g1_i1.p1 TRINITY_DN14581_c2_g1~~TRINITY_DN14581_c2_g1_i1.p1  ORF type:complete len:159 (+),score=16.79 TRINITY_DN14581_c2_g1_i1:69-479(+)